MKSGSLISWNRTPKRYDEQISLQDDIGKLYQKVESELSKRERLVLKLRYGLYNEEILTQREIAKQLVFPDLMSLGLRKRH